MDLATLVPLAGTLGIDVVSDDTDEVRARLGWAPELCTAGGVLHGGVLMALADTAGAMLAFRNLPEGARTATLESKTNFFRPLTAGAATATARPLHVGRTTIVVQTDVTDDDGRRVSQTTQTQAVIPGA